jgi:hypothetical protein
MSKVKESSTILNILMIVIGLVFIFKSILELLAWAGVVVPDALLPILTEAGALSIFGSLGLISIALGFWCIVSGIGMFREAEWAMGQALVVLSIMVLSGIPQIITWIMNFASFDVEYWPNYITIIAFLVGVFGFIWLLITRKRYA